MNTKEWEFQRRLRRAVSRRPFLILVRHFSRRAVGGSDTASEVDLGVGGVLAILALPGAFTAIGLAMKYGSFFLWIHGTLQRFNSYRASIADEYFFLVYSMAVAGFVTIVRWDHLLPGRRDFANLAALPLKLRSVFLANATALGLTSLVFALDINAFSGFFFPLLITWHGTALGPYFQVCFAHWSAVLGLTLFTMLSILSLQGLLMALLPDALYRRISLALRTVLLVFFLGLLVSAFVFPLSILNVALGTKIAGSWWPPIWFLSLYESLLTPIRELSQYGASWALAALGLAALILTVSFTLSYSRYFLLIAERHDGVSQPSKVSLLRLSWLRHVLRLWLRAGPEIAAFQFVVKTILRSETHLLFAGLWAGIAFLLSLEGLTGVAARGSSAHNGAILAAPLIFSLGLMSGLRYVFDIPSTLSANWAFRLAAGDATLRLERVSKSVILSFALPPVLLIWFPLAVRALGESAAAPALSMDLLFLWIGADLLLLGYRKIPCTCSFTANRDRMLRLLLVCVATLVFVIPIFIRLEAAVVEHPLRLMLFGPALVAAIAIAESAERTRQASAVFEDHGLEPFALLRLAGD